MNTVVQSPMEKKPRLPALQVLRAIGAGLIFFSHAVTKYGGFGGAGVSLFFIISGFVMSYNNCDKELTASLPGALRFAGRKIKKLYIVHIAVLIWLLLQSKRFTPRIIGLNVLLLKTWFPLQATYFSMGGVSWFLCDMAFIYVLFPFILKRIKRLKSARMAFLHAVVVYAVMLALGFSSRFVKVPETVSTNFPKWFTYVFPIFRMGDFIIGCDLGCCFLESLRSPVGRERRDYSHWFSAAEAAVLLAFCAGLYLRVRLVGWFGKSWFGPTLSWAPLSAGLVFLFACGRGALSKGLEKIRPLVTLGNLSTYTFLIHPQIIHLCEDSIKVKGGGRANTVIIVITAFVLTQMVGHLFKLVLERKGP